MSYENGVRLTVVVEVMVVVIWGVVVTGLVVVKGIHAGSSLVLMTGAAVVVEFGFCRANNSRLVIDRFKHGRFTISKGAIKKGSSTERSFTYSKARKTFRRSRYLSHSRPFPIAQILRHLRSFPTPEVHEPYVSIWRGLELADNPHMVARRGSNSALRRESKANNLGNAWALLPMAMNGSKDYHRIAFANRVPPH